MKNLVAGFNRSYGLYVLKCIGGRMTQSVGFGNGDSAFYVGGTPFQTHPVQTLVDHDIGYETVLGYSGTNSKYVVIRDSEFYNNGAGIVPNTLKSEPFEPASSGTIGIRFRRTFVAPGKYHFVCTIHPGTMNLTVIVKK